MDKKINAKEFLERFNQTHPYIQHELNEAHVQKWLNQKILNKHIDLVEALFEDYVMSQGFGTLHGE